MTERVVLLVDDEKVVLDTLSEQLEEHFAGGLSLETAESVAEGWEVIEALHGQGVTVVVVVSDWLMPGTKGDEFLAGLHARFPRIGRILLTGHADPAALERARLASDIQVVVAKPWRVDVLCSAIEYSMAGNE